MTNYELSMTNKYDYNWQIAIGYLSTTIEIEQEDLKGFQSLTDGSVEITPDHMHRVIDHLVDNRNTASWLSGYNENDLQNNLIKELIKINKVLIEKELNIKGTVFDYIREQNISVSGGINWDHISHMTREQVDRLQQIAKYDIEEDGTYRLDIYRTEDPENYQGRVHGYRD